MPTVFRLFRTALLVAFLSAATAVAALADNLVVTVDAGHGGTEDGATAVYDGALIREKDLNLIIADALRDELLTYDGVTVCLTRESDQTVSLADRTAIADEHQSDLLISIHNNAEGDAQDYTSGTSVLVSDGQYFPELAACEASLGELINEELHRGPGTRPRGLLRRLSASSTYPNGAPADYYALIRDSTLRGFPAVIVEHAFLDDKNDYSSFLRSKKKLRALGIADAAAIARYFGLSKKDGSVRYDAAGDRVRMLSRHWMRKNGALYYVLDDGSYRTGWYQTGEYLYYFKPSGAAATGLLFLTGEDAGTYFFEENGRLLTSWHAGSDKKLVFHPT